MMPIATVRLRYEEPQREARLLLVAVGTPYRTDEGDWACPIAIDGLETRLAETYGLNALQALCLGISVIRTRLAELMAKGGRLLDDDGKPLDLDAQLGSTQPSKPRPMGQSSP